VGGLTARVQEYILDEVSDGVHEADVPKGPGDFVRCVLTNRVDSLAVSAYVPHPSTDLALREGVWNLTVEDSLHLLTWEDTANPGYSHWVEIVALDAGGAEVCGLTYLTSAAAGTLKQLQVNSNDLRACGLPEDIEAVRVQVRWERSKWVSAPPYGTSCHFSFKAVTTEEFGTVQPMNQ
jgi:hypothetical protein